MRTMQTMLTQVVQVLAILAWCSASYPFTAHGINDDGVGVGISAEMALLVPMPMQVHHTAST